MQGKAAMHLSSAPSPLLPWSSLSSTKWFKRGELQTVLATRTAAAGATDPVSGPMLEPVDDNPPLSADDVDRLSLLGVAGLDTVVAVTAVPIPGERMTDLQIVSEGGRWFRLVLLLGALGLLGVAAVLLVLAAR